ncbi:MAG: hypothetical protein IJZ75_06130 [Clostridia bacterium]|nr:hypothetical protein [Clostridia bacterium]
MQKIFSKRILMSVVAFFGCIAIAVTALAVPSIADSTRTITVDTNTVLNDDYHGLGDNLWVGPYAYGMNDAYQTVNDQRTNTVKPAFMRMMFLPNWLVDAELTPEEQEYNWTNGIYTWDSEEFKSFLRNAQTIYNGGGEILLNMGGRITVEMAEWYAIEDVSLTEGGTRSAPKDIDAFARATVAIINKLKENGVEVNYLCFHNEVNGGNFEAFHDKRAYWAEVVKRTSIELDKAGLRDLEKNQAGVRDGVYIFATELAGWADETPIRDFISFCDEHLIKKGYADGISNHQYQHAKGRETVLELSYKLKELFPDIDLFINEFNGKYTDDPYTGQSGNESRSGGYLENTFSNLLTHANAGYSGSASWFYYGTLIAHPMNVGQSSLNICYWEAPSEGLERVSMHFTEKALAARYIPKHSATYKTDVDAEDIYAATYAKDDDCTVLVEFDKCDTDRTIKVELGSKYAGKTFGIHITNTVEDIDQNGYIDDVNIPVENGDLLAARRETVTADQNGTLTWTLKSEDSYVNGFMAFTTMAEQIQVVLEDAELSVMPGGSVDISVKDIFGIDCDEFNFEIYDYSSAADEEEDYAFASDATLASVGTLDQGASGIATFTAASNLNVGDTIAIKVTPNVPMPEETAGYVIAIVRVGEYRLYLNHMFAQSQSEYCSFLYEIGSEVNLEAPKTTGMRNPDIITAKGLTFQGWYTNPEFTGEPITKTDATWDSTVHLYGKWAAAATE